MLDFPNAPPTNQTFTSGGNSWLFDGAKWQSNIAQYSNNVGRNLIHNPLFNIAQRGAGPWTVSGSYTTDRWLISLVGGSETVSQIALPDGDRAAIGDESARYCLQSVCVGSAGAGDSTQMYQGIEDVRRLSGKTVTVSFWAKAVAGTPKLGISLFQLFGSGGSPSAAVGGIGSQAVTLSTSWARYTSAPIVMPSVSGKVFGTTVNTDYSGLIFWLSSGSTNNANSGGVGVQSYTLLLWGVQLEVGSTATPLEKPDPQQDLAKCQRFYQVYPSMFITGGVAGAVYGYTALSTG
jgi:hypothetical protein